MDKFGIFNLLNSFYDFYAKNKSEKSATAAPTESSLPTPNAETPKTNSQSLPPLQYQMKATMKTHDEIVKRVMANAKK